MARKAKVRANIAGVREVLKSDGVAAMLGTQAKAAAARCNDLYSLKTEPDTKPYGAMTVQRGYTAGGLVYAATPLGVADNLSNNTLKKGCGI